MLSILNMEIRIPAAALYGCGITMGLVAPLMKNSHMEISLYIQTRRQLIIPPKKEIVQAHTYVSIYVLKDIGAHKSSKL